MRIFRNIVIVFLLTVLAAMSAVGFLAHFPSIMGRPMTRLNLFGANIVDRFWIPGYGFFWFWLLILLLFVLAAVLSLIAFRTQANIEVQMAEGRVVIRETAIRQYIRTALADLQEITSRKICLRQTRQGLDTEILARVRTADHLPELQRQVILRVRKALVEHLGITRIAGVRLTVKDFEIRPRPEPPRSVAASREETAVQERSREGIASQDRIARATSEAIKTNASREAAPEQAVPEARPVEERAIASPAVLETPEVTAIAQTPAAQETLQEIAAGQEETGVEQIGSDRETSSGAPRRGKFFRIFRRKEPAAASEMLVVQEDNVGDTAAQEKAAGKEIVPEAATGQSLPLDATPDSANPQNCESQDASASGEASRGKPPQVD